MGLTDDIITLIREYAAALMLPSEIAILVGVEPSERKAFALRCSEHIGTPEYEAFQSGRLETKLALRRNIVKLAKAGSPIAEPIAERFLREQNYD